MNSIRMTAAWAAAILALVSGGWANAQALRALSPDDAALYAAAFDSAAKGDTETARQLLDRVQDKCLVGYVEFNRLMGPKVKASFDELADWLGKFADLTGADKILSLAKKRAPDPSAVAGYASLETHQPEGQGRLYVSARDAFYSGDAKAAHSLAVATGERWVAGLAAFRLKNFADARYRFDQVAADADEDPWLRAAGAYWAARSEIALGRPEAAPAYLRIAARWPRSFYGMLAESQLGYEPGAGERIPAPRVERRAEEDGPLIKAAFTPAPHADLDGMIARDDRAKRAAALMQVGRVEEASGELKKGFLTARSEQERGQWVALAVELNSDSQPKGRNQPPRYRDFNADDYPTPDYQPIGGYTVDRALVYALVKQESKFNPQVTSSAGAIGLMQVRPGTAADATGDNSFKYNAKPLYDPAWNLRAGQDYIDFLQRRWTR
ncbi:MAG: transglycosylase SLT domain-containing protein, partial [Caulobacteraceae bacterium]